jgi:hypothetical protein
MDMAAILLLKVSAILITGTTTELERIGATDPDVQRSSLPRY